MTAIIQVLLWAFVIYETCEKIHPFTDILKRRRKLKRLVKMNMRLSKNADSDYAAGFFYGLAKHYENELKETRYFE